MARVLHSTSLRMVFLLWCGAWLLGGCGAVDNREQTKGWDAKKLYSEAKAAMKSGDYEAAIDYYEVLESRFPLGKLAQQAQLDLIYAYYRYEEPASALAAADRFIKMHPRHPNVDYAHYIKGIVTFNQNFGLMERFLPIDLAQRDQAAAKESFQYFSELVKKYPDSPYAEDARQRMFYLRNNLARYELAVADYYLRRGAFVAAANRAQYVVQHYDRTPAVPDALAMMAQAYDHLGMEKLAADARRVRALNYRDHPAAE